MRTPFPHGSHGAPEHAQRSGQFQALRGTSEAKDPLGFVSYKEKLLKSRAKSKLKDAIITGEATIEGYPAVIGVMDYNFMLGSMGSVVGEQVARAVERGDREEASPGYSLRQRCRCQDAGRNAFFNADGKDQCCSGEAGQGQASSTFPSSQMPPWLGF